MKKVLIIGERGFIGKSLHKFLKHKHKVKLMSFKNAINYKLSNGYDFVINTSTNKDYIKKVFKGDFVHYTNIIQKNIRWILEKCKLDCLPE